MSGPTVLIWSSFDEASRRIYGMLSAMPNIQCLNVDHPQIRAKLIASTRIKINLVPCILESVNSQLHQFEGAQAMQWVQERMSPQKYAPQYQPQQQYQQQQYQQQQYQQQYQQQFPPQPQLPPGIEPIRFIPSAGPREEAVETSSDPRQPPPQPQYQPPPQPGYSPQQEIKFVPSAGPSQQQDTPVGGTTPISMVQPEPNAQQSAPSYSAEQAAQAAQKHYEQYAPKKSEPSMSPKESSFQRVLEQARLAAQAQEQEANKSR